MVQLLEKAVTEEKVTPRDIMEAGVISIKGSEKIDLLGDYSKQDNASIYACDAVCDNCHCATY